MAVEFERKDRERDDVGEKTRFFFSEEKSD